MSAVHHLSPGVNDSKEQTVRFRETGKGTVKVEKGSQKTFRRNHLLDLYSLSRNYQKTNNKQTKIGNLLKFRTSC